LTSIFGKKREFGQYMNKRNFIDYLRKEDFDMFENGKRQKIVDFLFEGN